jgi:hypothetical protein
MVFNDTEFEELDVVIDTREKDNIRINTFKSYFESRGACVTKGTLHRCDYSIEGIYRDIPIKLGIEYKSLDDFAGSHSELPWKMVESYDTYEDVALFVEMGQYDLQDLDDGGSMFCNYAIRDKIGVLRYDVFQNMLRSFAMDGVYIQTYPYTFEFPRSAHNLMNYIVKPMHNGIRYKPKSFEEVYTNMLMQMPGIGLTNAKKIKEHFKNFYELCVFAEPHHIDAVGNATGKKLHKFFHSGEMIDNDKR